VNQVRTDVEWTALEYREECRTPLIHAVGTGLVVIEDYIVPPDPSQLVPGFEVALGNPPYRLAAEFIARSLDLAKTLALLLRVNYLASEKRNVFMRSLTPDIYVLPNRPSFRGEGTDSPEYAWFLWSGERGRTRGRLRVLNTTPLEVRQAQKALLPLSGKRQKKKAGKEAEKVEQGAA
jgi:hypothetical protein